MAQRFYPPLPPDLVTFVEGAPSLLVGTRDERLRPDAVRAVGMRVWPGASQLTIYLAAATSARAVANARATGQLALTMAHPPTHQTYQIKGAVLDVREAGPEDRAAIERYVDDFAEVLAIVGLPRQLTRRLTAWPAFAVDLDIAEVFAQTPGPGAGSRMSSP
jgi:Pyridoxamine 5'-phosphate oxidase